MASGKIVSGYLLPCYKHVPNSATHRAVSMIFHSSLGWLGAAGQFLLGLSGSCSTSCRAWRRLKAHLRRVPEHLRAPLAPLAGSSLQRHSLAFVHVGLELQGADSRGDWAVSDCSCNSAGVASALSSWSGQAEGSWRSGPWVLMKMGKVMA